jgi:hypothetical protein
MSAAAQSPNEYYRAALIGAALTQMEESDFLAFTGKTKTEVRSHVDHMEQLIANAETVGMDNVLSDLEEEYEWLKAVAYSLPITRG